LVCSQRLNYKARMLIKPSLKFNKEIWFHKKSKQISKNSVMLPNSKQLMLAMHVRLILLNEKQSSFPIITLIILNHHHGKNSQKYKTINSSVSLK